MYSVHEMVSRMLLRRIHNEAHLHAESYALCPTLEYRYVCTPSSNESHIYLRKTDMI